MRNSCEKELVEKIKLQEKPVATEELLERFVDLYGEVPLQGAMIARGIKLWRDYYEFTGQHMILTDEGWEPGEAKQSYLDATPEGWSNPILDEVNNPLRKAEGH